mgnify:FL=1
MAGRKPLEGRPPWGSSLGIRQKTTTTNRPSRVGLASRPSTAPSPRGTAPDAEPAPSRSPKKKRRSVAKKPAAEPAPSAHEENCEAAKEVAELIGRRVTPPQSPKTASKSPRRSPRSPPASTLRPTIAHKLKEATSPVASTPQETASRSKQSPIRVPHGRIAVVDEPTPAPMDPTPVESPTGDGFDAPVSHPSQPVATPAGSGGVDIGRGDKFGSPAEDKTGSPLRDKFGSPIEEKPESPAAPRPLPAASGEVQPPASSTAPPATPVSVSAAARRRHPEPTELLLEGGEPFVDVRALTAPGGALYALTLDAARPKIARIGSSDANGSTPSPKRRVRADDDTDDEGDDDDAVYRAAKFAVRLVESAATELAGASRELTAAADEDVTQTAAEVSRAEVADVEDAVMVALLNARSAAARAERRRLLQQIAQRATDWVCAVQPSLGALPARLNAAMAERAADAKRAADAPVTPSTPAVMDHRVVQELQRDLASARAEVATAKEEAAAAKLETAAAKQETAAARREVRPARKGDAPALTAAAESTADAKSLLMEERMDAAAKLASITATHQAELARLKTRIARAENEAATAKVETEQAKANAEECKSRMEKAERFAAESRERTSVALGNSAAEHAKYEAAEALVRSLTQREEEALRRAKEAEMRCAQVEGSIEAKIESESTRIVLDNNVRNATLVSDLRAELAEARAAQRRAETRAADAEEHEREAAAGEVLRVRAECAAARRNEAATRRELDEHRVAASAAAAARHEEIEGLRRDIVTLRNQLEARVEAAEERARVAQAQLAANREAAAMESAQVAEQSNSLRRQAAEAERKLREEIVVVRAELRGARAGEAAAIAREEEVMSKAVELIEQRDEQLRQAKDLHAAELRAALARQDDEMRALRRGGSLGDLHPEFVRNVERALQDERRRRVAAEEDLVNWKRAARESRREMEESREVAEIGDGLGRLRRQLSRQSSLKNSLKIPDRDKPIDAALLSPVDSPPRRRTPPPNVSQRLSSPRGSPRVSGGTPRGTNARDSQGSGRSDPATRAERFARDSSLNVFASKEGSQVSLKIAPAASPPPVPPQSRERVTPAAAAAAAAAPKPTWTPGYEGLQSPTQRAALLEEVLSNIESL